MRVTLMPAADALGQANQRALESAYERQRSESAWGSASLCFFALILLATLIVAQGFIQLRMHRRISPLLLLATLVVGFQVIATLGRVTAEAHDLKVVKEDAFDSLAQLWHARADVADAQGQLTLSLLDPRFRQTAAESFDADMARLASIPFGETADSLAAQVDRGLPQGFTGSLAAELRNITFSGEKEAAVEWLRAVRLPRPVQAGEPRRARRHA